MGQYMRPIVKPSSRILTLDINVVQKILYVISQSQSAMMITYIELLNCPCMIQGAYS